jgi:hypothetical protein
VTPSPSWIQDFLTAVTEAEQREHQAVELSEAAARKLLAWCLDGPDRGSSSTAGGQPEGNPLPGISCTVCGGRVYSIPSREPSYAGGGNPLDHLWLCPSDRARMAGIWGTPPSPGRPERSASQQRVARYRAMSASMRSRSQAPAPAAPRMPASSPPKPSAPGQPQPGPWS